jgi:glycosyltransferase 2 family protein
MSISFINLAVPSAAARVALEVRYFQQQGVAAAKALTFGALDSVSLFITQLMILIVTVGFGLTSLDFSLDTAKVGGAAKLAAAAVVAIAIGLVVVVAVPRLRRWVLAQLAQARDALRGIGSINRWGLLFGGNLLAQILFSATLGLCVLAFGYHISLVNLMAINVMVSFFAGLMPVPGGIGVTEAALTAGLVAAGVPQTQALSAVLVYRVFTYYLPPAWGFFTLRWLRNHDYL